MKKFYRTETDSLGSKKIDNSKLGFKVKNIQ